MELKYFRNIKTLITALLSSRSYHRRYALEILENFSDYIERFEPTVAQIELLFRVLLELELPDRLLKIDLRKISTEVINIKLLLRHSSTIRDIKLDIFIYEKIRFFELRKLELLMRYHTFSLKEIDNLTLSHKNLEELDLSGGELERLIDFEQFTSLRVLKLSMTKIFQTFDWFRFPDTLTSLTLEHLVFSGKIDLNRLPPALKFLSIFVPGLECEIDFTRLPRNLETFFLSQNSYKQNLNLTQLPERLESLILINSAFNGELNLTELPRGLKVLELSNNFFSGLSEGRLSYLPRALERLILGEKLITKPELIEISKRIKQVKIIRNKFWRNE